MTTTDSTAKPRLEYDLTRLQALIGEFKLTDFWKEMQNTVEDSPWHREANVAFHTEMTLVAAAKHFPKPTLVEYDSEREQLLKRFEMECVDTFSPGNIERLNAASGERRVAEEHNWFNRRHIVLVSLALLFHDTGKPAAEVTKISDERGEYRSYAGHEAESARRFEGYVIDNWAMFEGLITIWDVYVITWMIEHHLPYGLKNKDKVLALDKSLVMTFLPNGPEVFFNMLKGDTEGRDSDDYAGNCGRMMDWIAERQSTLENMGATVFHLNEQINNKQDTPEMIMMIGPSGAGKSSLRAALPGFVPFSLDDLRYKFALGHVDVMKGISPECNRFNYHSAYEYAVANEKEFDAYVTEAINAVFKDNKHILVDNTNLGAKRRKRYIDMARQRGMRVTALYIPASLQQLLDRQHSRPDKQVPDGSVKSQFYSVAVPSFGGEFDSVNIAPHNFGV